MEIILTNVHVGPPLAPSVSLTQEHFVNNTFLLTLNWSKPFTWSNFPITSYTITITNYSSGEPISTTNITYSNGSGTDGCHQYIGEGNDCYRLDISVAANNSLGKGQHTTVQSGHLIGEIIIIVII